MGRAQRPRVLVIDDDEQITGFLRRALAYSGFDVDAANGGEEGLRLLGERPPDVLVLDVLMPGTDGVEVCRRVREGEGEGNGAGLPILMLTARDAVPDRVRGLEGGADDYLAKPFALDELVARLRALVRRGGERRSRGRTAFGDLSADAGERRAWRGERELSLSAREFDLLLAFLRQPRQVLSRTQLLDQVWGYAAEVDEHVLEVYVGYLREKLESGGEPRLIQTVRGVGYVLRDPAP